MTKNPLSYKDDIETLLAELRKPNSDLKTIVHLRRKINAKAMAQGMLIGTGLGLVSVAAGFAVGLLTFPETEED